MAITYNAGTNTITVTGYTKATPCTFLDIYNANIAGGWGVVTRQCINQFCFDARIHVGDGSTVTWFADESQLIVYTDAAISAHYQSLLTTPTNGTGHCRLGRCIDATKKTTGFGCMIVGQEPIYWNQPVGGEYPNHAANIELYGCSFYAIDPSTGDPFIGYIDPTSKIYDCLLSGVSTYLVNADFNNVLVSSSPADAFQYPSGTFNKISAVECTYGVIYIGGAATSDLTVKNPYGRNNGAIRLRSTSYDLMAINADFDAWSFAFHLYTGKCYRQYEFYLKVQDKDETPINEAVVKIWDKNNNLVANTTTGATGTIATQTLNYGYYNQAGGDTPTMQTPHTIQISKAGYETYKKKWTIDEKIDWRIRLLQANPVQFLEGNPILQLCPESQEDDRTLFEVI